MQKKTVEASREIIEVLKKYNCTVQQSKRILKYTKKTVLQTSTVQFDGLFPYGHED